MKWGWGGGRCQKSETKRLRHDSKPGCGVARRPGAASGSCASTWQGPRRGARFLCLPPGARAPPQRAPEPEAEALAEGGGPEAQWGGSLWGLTGGETTDLISRLLQLHFLVSKSLLSRKKALLLPNSAHPPRAETRVVWAGDATRGSVGPDRKRRLALGAAGTPGPASLRGRRRALLVGGLRPQPLPDLCREALEPLEGHPLDPVLSLEPLSPGIRAQAWASL